MGAHCESDEAYIELDVFLQQPLLVCMCFLEAIRPPTPPPLRLGVPRSQRHGGEARFPRDLLRDSPGTIWIPSPFPPSALH